MPKRIPHSDLKVITGQQTTEAYLEMQKRLGRFYLIYSTFSLHHWKNPVKGIQHLYQALNNKGVLLIYDFERHWLTYYLPLKRGILESIRASYTPGEIFAMISGLNIGGHYIQHHFPYLSILITK